MNESAMTCSPVSINWAQMNTQNPITFLKNLDDLLDDFGPEQLGNAATRQFFERFAEKLKDQIDASDLPPALKDMARDVVDAHLQRTRAECPCSAEASEAVSNCAQSQQINEAADEACSSCCAGDSTAPSGSADTASTSGMTSQEQAEAAQEAQNEGRPASTSSSDGSDTAADAAIGLQDSDKEKRKGANWLEVLALSLAEVQSKFLNKALDASTTMAEESDNVAPGGKETEKSQKFLEAQALFTANMQMFSLFANQSSTALKSVGEGLSAIARKQ